MDERASFAYEVMPLRGVAWDFTLEEFAGDAVTVAEATFAEIDTPTRAFAPFLLTQVSEELDVVVWGPVTGDYADNALDRLVPETVAALCPDRVALINHAEIAQLAPGSGEHQAVEAIYISIRDSKSELDESFTALAAAVQRHDDSPPTLGPFSALPDGPAESYIRALAGTGD